MPIESHSNLQFHPFLTVQAFGDRPLSVFFKLPTYFWEQSTFIPFCRFGPSTLTQHRLLLMLLTTQLGRPLTPRPVRTTNNANRANNEHCERRTVRTVHIVRTVRTTNSANSSYCANSANNEQCERFILYEQCERFILSEQCEQFIFQKSSNRANCSVEPGPWNMDGEENIKIKKKNGSKSFPSVIAWSKLKPLTSFALKYRFNENSITQQLKILGLLWRGQCISSLVNRSTGRIKFTSSCDQQ